MSRIEEAIEKAARRRNAHSSGDTVKDRQLSSCSGDIQVQLVSDVGSKAGRRIRMWLSAGVIMLALVIAYSSYHGTTVDTVRRQMHPAGTGAGNGAPALAKQVSTATARKAGLTIPSSLLSGTLDPNYSRTHLGWQRYCSDVMEFRLYRERGAVMAIQVVSLAEGAISEDFFSTFLMESAGRRVWTIRSREEKDGYSIDKGNIDEITEVLIYRKKPKGGITAFVIAYS
jgi:flagellar FliL protein